MLILLARAFLIYALLLATHAFENSSPQARRRHHHVTHRRIYRNLDALNSSIAAQPGAEFGDRSLQGDASFQNQSLVSNSDKAKSGVIITFSGVSAKKFQKSGLESNFGVYEDGVKQGEGPKSKLWFMSYTPGAYEMALNNTYSNISTQVGREAFLHCRVGHLGDTQISWIRKRDWHVLSSGKDLITPDSRFFVIHDPASRDWTLHIKRVTHSDAGTYECQVSTGSGIISMFVRLKVITPVVQILGTGSYHANMGSTIHLTCVIKQSFYTPQHVFWRRNGDILNFLKLDSQILINNTAKVLENLNEKESRSKATSRKRPKDKDEEQDEGELIKDITSQLKIEKADPSHSGNYTCSTPDGLMDSTMVFITEGDNIAAVQRIDSGGTTINPQAVSPMPLILLILLTCR